jgi:hypothetical protein
MSTPAKRPAQKAAQRPAHWAQRTTRHEPPGLEEAVAAAQDLSSELESQIEIAAMLMGLPEEEVRPVVLRAASKPKSPSRSPSRPSAPIRNGRGEPAAVVVVERRKIRLKAK